MFAYKYRRHRGRLSLQRRKGVTHKISGGESIQSDTGTGLWMIRVIFRVPIWFIWYPITVNKGIMGRQCGENKETIHGKLCQRCPHTSRNVSCMSTYNQLILFSSVQGIISTYDICQERKWPSRIVLLVLVITGHECIEKIWLPFDGEILHNAKWPSGLSYWTASFVGGL